MIMTGTTVWLRPLGQLHGRLNVVARDANAAAYIRQLAAVGWSNFGYCFPSNV